MKRGACRELMHTVACPLMTLLVDSEGSAVCLMKTSVHGLLQFVLSVPRRTILTIPSDFPGVRVAVHVPFSLLASTVQIQFQVSDCMTLDCEWRNDPMAIWENYSGVIFRLFFFLSHSHTSRRDEARRCLVAVSVGLTLISESADFRLVFLVDPIQLVVQQQVELSELFLVLFLQYHYFMLELVSNLRELILVLGSLFCKI